MKLLILLAFCAAVSACATNKGGEKTFLNRTGPEWGNIFLNTSKRTVPILKEEYDNSSNK